ncbi:MAG: hypothetical protein AMJ72_08620 [Acidithiobacillales bacterium SM1_46]|nr:MAG: hypothetical protein AMJ72_08620 [Acidithiobacillales bacterium SM1_46]
MANTAQAKKRARQAEAHRERNAAQRTWLRSKIREAASAIDRMAGRGIIHKNAAARYKRELNQGIKALA